MIQRPYYWGFLDDCSSQKNNSARRMEMSPHVGEWTRRTEIMEQGQSQLKQQDLRSCSDERVRHWDGTEARSGISGDPQRPLLLQCIQSAVSTKLMCDLCAWAKYIQRQQDLPRLTLSSIVKPVVLTLRGSWEGFWALVWWCSSIMPGPVWENSWVSLTFFSYFNLL